MGLSESLSMLALGRCTPGCRRGQMPGSGYLPPFDLTRAGSGVPGDRYLQEFAPLGTGGGLYHFRDQILAGGPEAFFVLNADVCSDFPLNAMLDAFRRQPHPFLLLGTTVRGPEGLEGGKGVIQRRFWNAECRGGRGSPGGESGNRQQEGNKCARKRNRSSSRGGEVAVETLSPVAAWKEGGGGQLSVLPLLKACQWQKYVSGAAEEGKQARKQTLLPWSGQVILVCLSFRLTGHSPSTTAALWRIHRHTR